MIRSNKQLAMLATLLMVVLAITPLLAQRLDGTLRGTVADQTGAAVAGAKVTVINVATGVSSTMTTSDVGVYNVPNLLIGTYTLTVEAPHFRTYERKNILIAAAQTTVADVKLDIGTGTETVEVIAGAEAVQTESSQLTTTFTGRQVSEVPTTFGAGGFLSVQNLAVFAPNTTTGLGGTSGTGGSVGGLRGRQNSFTIDGTNNNDQEVSVSSLEVIPDAVQEFSLSSNQYTAEYGNAAGGQFNVVTKSGTNNTHGSLYWYNNNKKLNAWDNTEKLRGEHDRYDFNRLGANIGGPIVTNKLFFFGAYEFNATGFKGSPATAVGPTSDGITMLNNLAVDQQVKDLLSQFPAALGATDAETVCKVTDRVNRTAAPTDTCFDVPMGPLSASSPSFSQNQQWLVNIDYAINDKHQLRFRHIKDRNRAPALGEFPQPQFTANSATDNRKMIVNEVWTVNNSFVNDFKATGSRLVTNSGVFQNSIAETYPTVVFQGAFTIGPLNNLPQSRTTNSYQVADMVTYLRGAHTFKGGAEYQWYTGPNDFLQNSRGQYTYLDLQEFVNDFIPANNGANLQGIGSGIFAQNRHNVSAFLQDDWKVGRRLTLNLGVRWEFFGIPVSANRNELDAVANCPECAANPYTPLVWHKPRNDMNNFAPRVGFAWDPTGAGKWAIRGGFGMGYDHIPGNFYLNGQPPQFQAILNPQTACAGAFGVKPAWCPASGLANAGTELFLANGAMKTTFVPPSDPTFARSITGNLLPDNVSPMVYNWSVGVQREVLRNTTVELRYLGTKATSLPVQMQLNSVTAFANGATPLPTYFSLSEVPATADASAPTRAQFNTFIKRPYAANGFVGVITNYPDDVGRSRYDSGAIDINRRMTTGLTLRANYTFSTNHDNATNDLFTSQVNPRRPEDFRNMRNEWGRSALDVRHKTALTWVYDVPKLNVDSAFGRALLHGWEYSGSYLYQAGQPVTVMSGIDANGNGDAATDRAIFNPNGRGRTGSTVSRVCRDPGTNAVSVSNGCSNGNTIGYVADNPAAKYIRADVGALTDIPRNTENSGAFNVFNMAFAKNTKVKESWTLQFRADLYNVFNHRNYTLGTTSIFPVTSNARSTTYANISAASVGGGGDFLNDKVFNGGSRIVQLGLRLTF